MEQEEIIRKTKIFAHVCKIIQTISFKGEGAEKPMSKIQGRVVRDADRFDALGVIGIARCFAYGSFKRNSIYVPSLKPRDDLTSDEYKKETSQINHFYEKLLLLKDLMCTQTGKQLALKRHEFMELYLNQFFAEWDGNA